MPTVCRNGALTWQVSDALTQILIMASLRMLVLLGLACFAVEAFSGGSSAKPKVKKVVKKAVKKAPVNKAVRATLVPRGSSN